MAHLDFEFRFKGAGAPRRRDDDAPLRLLVVSDFSGRASRGVCEPLVGRTAVAVDLDTLDAACRRIAPCVEWDDAAAPGGRLRLEPRALDDFHPDHLYATLPLLRALRDTRERLTDPRRFAAAAAELRQAAATPPGAAPAAGAEDDGSTLERLLGRAPQDGAAAAAADPLQSFIGRIVAPHIVPAADPLQATYVASVDAAIGAALRAILHAPAFQALEAVWRGVAWLVSRLELGEALQLFILDASKAELAADLAAAGGELERCALHRLLARDEAPWSLVAGCFACDAGEADVALLAALGALAGAAGAAFVADAAPALLGCDSFAATPDPRDWAPPSPPAQARWRALRASGAAPWLALAAPRLLLRLPYGAKADPVEAFAFEEFAGSRNHAHYLWGSAALACAERIGRAFGEDGWDMAPEAAGDIDDLPAHTYVEDGEARMQPCAEVALSERGAEALLAAGLVPLVGSRHRNAVRIVRVQSLAQPPRPLQGPWLNG